MAADPVRRAGNGSHSGRGRDDQLVAVGCSTRRATTGHFFVSALSSQDRLQGLDFAADEIKKG